MKSVEIISSDIHLSNIYCSIQRRPKNAYGVRFSCECKDERLSIDRYWGNNGIYLIYDSKDFKSQSIAYGFMSEQVYIASKYYPHSSFRYCNENSGITYCMEYPNDEWLECPKMHYECPQCTLTKTIKGSWLLIKDFIPACDDCLVEMNLIATSKS
jgi:hypothetical protein